MKTRIIFFDDEPQTNRQYRAFLEQKGYEICTPSTVEEAFHEINVNGAELLIHGAHKTKTHWQVCDAVFEQYPQFPSLHFATGPISENNHAALKGPFHQKVRPLMPHSVFLKKVHKLIFMGRLNAENHALRKVVALQKRIDLIFDTLELEELKTSVVNFFAHEFKAKNVFFLSPGGYGYFMQEMWKVASMGALSKASPDAFHPNGHAGESQNGRAHGHQHRYNLVSAKPAREDELSAYINQVSPHLAQGWELRHERTYVQHAVGAPTRIKAGDASSFCFVPLYGHQSKQILGHVLMIEPLLYGEKALEKVFPFLTRVLGRHLEHVLSFNNAKGLSYIDDLTLLYNQRYLKLILDKEISRCGRANQPFSVLFMDIDHFKSVNDTRGHMIGSQVLVEMSKILSENIRTQDYGFRYGGDEFLLILVNTDSKQALFVAERIRKQVESSVFRVQGNEIKLTLSIGIAAFPEHAKTKEQVIELADRAMYFGKHSSRNVVYVAS